VRAFLFDTSTRLARLDLDDREEVVAAVQQIRELLTFCTNHIAHENQFVHTAMEARQPGSSAATAHEHAHHAETVARLLTDSQVLESGADTQRHFAWRRLQRDLALFTGNNLLHMDTEESHNNAVLQACYTDAELEALHQQILAAPTPDEMAMSLRWILVGSSPAERSLLMAGVRADAPPPVFGAMMNIARENLSGRDWNKLAVALAGPAAAIAA
jgi:hypothetical protein